MPPNRELPEPSHGQQIRHQQHGENDPGGSPRRKNHGHEQHGHHPHPAKPRLAQAGAKPAEKHDSPNPEREIGAEHRFVIAGFRFIC
jgi:hypothetical protein